MISLSEPELPRSKCAYQIRIVLQETKPEVWRCLQIPGNANLGWLHAVAQVAMGWTNSHLHQFHHRDQLICDPSFGLNENEDDPPVLDEWKVLVNSLLTKPGQTFLYEYDFGDSWHHLVELEKIIDSGVVLNGKAVCLAGGGACPPEDCGGVSGYDQLLRVMKNPKHPEHKSMKQWLGRPFDPKRFSMEEANRWLVKVPWPKVTEAALRRILMGRDGA